MARADATQLNIRSRFARERAAAIAQQTGMTTTQVVEEALRVYLPPIRPAVSDRLIRKGAILVMPAGGQRVSLDQANDALDDARSDRG